MNTQLFHAPNSDNRHIVSKRRGIHGFVLMALVSAALCIGALEIFGQTYSLDTSFTNGPLSATAYLQKVAVQPDGKILLGGNFSSYGSTTVSNIVRLEANGTVDSSFNPGAGFLSGASIGLVLALAVQPDGKILAGGTFTSVNGVARTNLVRLNTNGTVDMSFDAKIASGSVLSFLLQTNGTIYIGGGFTTVAGASRPGVALLETNGTLNTSFLPDLTATYFGPGVHGIAVQPADGKVLIAGTFRYLNPGLAGTGLLRLNAGGGLDGGFTVLPLTSYTQSALDMVLQTNGQVVISGQFDTIGGASHIGIGAVDTGGALSGTWPGTGVYSVNSSLRNVKTMVGLPNGKILIGGPFSQYNGNNTSGFVRLNSDGSYDTTFTNGSVSAFQPISMALAPDGSIALAGSFIIGGTSYSVVRLKSSVSSPTLTFSLPGGNVLHFDVPAGFKLQQSTLPTGTWSDVPGSPPFDLPMTNAMNFFQLISL